MDERVHMRMNAPSASHLLATFTGRHTKGLYRHRAPHRLVTGYKIIYKKFTETKSAKQF